MSNYAKRWLKNASLDGLRADMRDAGFLGTDAETGELTPVNCSLIISPVNMVPRPTFDSDGTVVEEGVDNGPHANLRVDADDERLNKVPSEGESMQHGTEVLPEPQTPWHEWWGS